MSWYRAEDVYAELRSNGCEMLDQFDIGTGWISSGASQSFFLPDPVERDGIEWFDADAIDDNLLNRWIPFNPRKIRRYGSIARLTGVTR